MAEVKWIKITTDIFDDEKMLLIESLPDANAIIVVWFKLLCLAGKTNNSGVFMLNDKIAYTDKMLSTIFRMKETTVQLALQTFEQFGMIELIDGVITIPNWGKHQTLDKISARNEYMREYMQEYRAKQKGIACKVNGKVNSKVNVSALEEEVEEDKEYIPKGILSIPYTEIIDYLNKKTGKNFRSSTPKTQKLIKARWNEGYRLDDFIRVIDTKCSQWLKDTKMNKYLQPETLFGTKFEGYLNENVKKSSGYGSLEGFAPTVTDTDIGDFD